MTFAQAIKMTEKETNKIMGKLDGMYLARFAYEQFDIAYHELKATGWTAGKKASEFKVSKESKKVLVEKLVEINKEVKEILAKATA